MSGKPVANSNLIQQEIDLAKQMLGVEVQMRDLLKQIALKQNKGEGGIEHDVVRGAVQGAVSGKDRGTGGGSSAIQQAKDAATQRQQLTVQRQAVAQSKHAAYGAPHLTGARTAAFQVGSALRSQSVSGGSYGTGTTTMTPTSRFGSRPVPPTAQRYGSKGPYQPEELMNLYKNWEGQTKRNAGQRATFTAMGKLERGPIPAAQMTQMKNAWANKQRATFTPVNGGGGGGGGGSGGEGAMAAMAKIAPIAAVAAGALLKGTMGTFVGQARVGDNLSVYQSSQQEANARHGSIQGLLEIGGGALQAARANPWVNTAINVTGTGGVFDLLNIQNTLLSAISKGVA